MKKLLTNFYVRLGAASIAAGTFGWWGGYTAMYYIFYHSWWFLN